MKEMKVKVRNEMESKMTFPWQSTHKPRNLEMRRRDPTPTPNLTLLKRKIISI